MNQLFFSLKDFWSYDFLIFALIGTLLLSFMCGLISPLIIARKNAFMGSAISHSTILGLAISVSLFGPEKNIEIFFCTLLVTLVCTIFLAHSTFNQRLPSDSLIGIFYTSTIALGIIIHSVFSKSKTDLLSFLFGNILLLSPQDIFISSALFVIVCLIFLIPFKKWIFLTYDEEAAITSGMKVSRYHYTFFVLLCLLIVTSIKLAGTVLVETLLLVPGFFALKFSQNIKQTFIFSILFSVISSCMGIFIANAYSLPSGATLAFVLFMNLMISLLIKQIHDLLTRVRK